MTEPCSPNFAFGKAVNLAFPDPGLWKIMRILISLRESFCRRWLRHKPQLFQVISDELMSGPIPFRPSPSGRRRLNNKVALPLRVLS
jgi:hypothetical protein